MFRKIKQIIDGGNKFLITTHIDPDGDAIGSCFSLYWALVGLQKNPFVYMRDRVPYMYEFLPKPTQLFYNEPPDGTYDGIFILDCGNFFRVGNGHERLKSQGPIINIDHHATSEKFGIINIINQNSSSTGEILYNIYDALMIPISYNIAVNLYTAIFTDTGSFRYPNTNSEAFLICEKMTKFGVSPAHVAQMVYENHPKERFVLLGEVLSSLETYENDTIALAVVTKEMFHKTNTTKEYTEGFVEFIKEIRGVNVAILMKELSDNQYKISMRSKGDTDVALICNHFGGGGHRNAAGCTINGSIIQIKDRLKEALTKP